MSDDEAAELRRKLEQARRLANVTTDQTTVQRLWEFAEELSEKLHNYFIRRRTREEIRARARELWEESGKPEGRDLEFWLQAEKELEGDRTEE